MSARLPVSRLGVVRQPKPQKKMTILFNRFVKLLNTFESRKLFGSDGGSWGVVKNLFGRPLKFHLGNEVNRNSARERRLFTPNFPLVPG